jgi:hypothetical protein
MKTIKYIVLAALTCLTSCAVNRAGVAPSYYVNGAYNRNLEQAGYELVHPRPPID